MEVASAHMSIKGYIEHEQLQITPHDLQKYQEERKRKECD